MKKLDYLQTAHIFLYINWARTGSYTSGKGIITIAISSGDVDPAYAKQHIRNYEVNGSLPYCATLYI